MTIVSLKARLRPAVNYGLWRLGVRDVLPSRFINRKQIRDDGSPLVVIGIDDGLFIDSELSTNKSVLLRAEVYDRLKKAKQFLPGALSFKIHDAYRSLDEQTRSWNERLEQTRALHPDEPEAEVKRLTSLKVANPESGFGGHQTGGAIDLTICDADGNDLDMGCGVAEYGPKTRTSSEMITEQQELHRQTLLGAMTQAGFVNFPAEWWHFCYGDRMWAAYSRKPFAIYGMVKSPTT